MRELTLQEVADFQKLVWQFFAAHRRDMPWRQPEASGHFDPYKIWISEVMLQQTQVARVVPKYESFLQKFPTIERLAAAELGEVLRAWQGLGYNRRAKFLWQAARQIRDNFAGHFPATSTELQTLPGIGSNTAGAILAYAHNQPVTFVETNIRTVYIHHFFAAQADISDKAILELVAQTLDPKRPREFLWALMDYGAYLKSSVGNVSRQAKNYTRQSAFRGSRRQLRGRIIALLGEKARKITELQSLIDDERLESVLHDLVEEHLIQKRSERYRL